MKKTVFITLFIFSLMGTGFTIDKIIATSLKITIRNNLGNIESGVTVTLYGNKEDFKKEQNSIQEGETNEKGVVTFKKLGTKAYFVTAIKGDMNNYGAGVQTNTLDANKVNKVTIIIE